MSKELSLSHKAYCAEIGPLVDPTNKINAMHHICAMHPKHEGTHRCVCLFEWEQ